MEKPLLYRVLFKIVNLAVLFLTFLAYLMSYGRLPSWRKDRIGVIQLFTLRIAKVKASSMLGRFWTSIFKSILVGPSSNDTCFAISFATIFWHLGICANSTRSNSYVKCFVGLRYFCILSSFSSYSSFICSTTSFESL